MLPKKERLRKKRDFDLVYQKGDRYSGKIILLFVLKNESPNSRCGFSISKKVSKKAVIRNKLRRRLGSIYREERNKLDKHVDLVFVARQHIEELSFADLKVLVTGLFEKAGIYRSA